MLTTTQSPVGQNQSNLTVFGKSGLYLAVALSAALLTACGGGGSSTTTVDTTTPTTTTPTTTTPTTTTPTTTTPTTTTPTTTTPTARTFTSMDANGGDITAGIEEVACVKDSSTGKTWEVKTNAADVTKSDFRDRDYGYFWQDGATTGVQGYAAGAADTSNATAATPCSGVGTALTRCDTGSYIKAVNTAKLCGFTTGWRLPTSDELIGLVDKTRTAAPYIYPAFINTSSDADNGGPFVRSYWSSTQPAGETNNRLAVSFSNKDDTGRAKSHTMGNMINDYLMLVHD
ncbi:MAG: hypothetical protein RL122_2602 [Pseudomonadota bacterium]